MFEIANAIMTGDTRQIIAQTLGIVAFLISAISYQCKTQRSIACLQIIACLFFTVHFYILGTVGGFILNLIGCIRAFVFTFRKKYRWAASVVWVYVFAVFIVTAGIYSFTVEGALAILPSVAMIITTFAIRMEKASRVRALTLLNSPFWLIYNIINGSFGGAITEIVNSCSIIIGMLRLDIGKKKKESSEAEGSQQNKGSI